MRIPQSKLYPQSLFRQRLKAFYDLNIVDFVLAQLDSSEFASRFVPSEPMKASIKLWAGNLSKAVIEIPAPGLCLSTERVFGHSRNDFELDDFGTSNFRSDLCVSRAIEFPLD